jgi:hypothetical protein
MEERPDSTRHVSAASNAKKMPTLYAEGPRSTRGQVIHRTAEFLFLSLLHPTQPPTVGFSGNLFASCKIFTHEGSGWRSALSYQVILFRLTQGTNLWEEDLVARGVHLPYMWKHKASWVYQQKVSVRLGVRSFKIAQKKKNSFLSSYFFFRAFPTVFDFPLPSQFLTCLR